MIQNEIVYSRTLIAAADSSDGETPTQLKLTNEENCYLLWITDAEGDFLIGAYRARDTAIGFSVRWGDSLIKDLNLIEQEKFDGYKLT